jgi:hypothetical protein
VGAYLTLRRLASDGPPKNKIAVSAPMMPRRRGGHSFNMVQQFRTKYVQHLD